MARDKGASFMPEIFGITPSYFVNSSTSMSIVGNSPKLKDSGFGTEIDSAEHVVRFNGAIVDGFESDVGAKTDAMCVGIDIAYMYGSAYVQAHQTDSKTDDEARRLNATALVHKFDGNFIMFKSESIKPWTCCESFIMPILIEKNMLARVYYFNTASAFHMDTADNANRFLEKLNLSTRIRFGGPRTGFKFVLRTVLSGIKPQLYGFDIDPSLKYAEHYYESICKDEISTVSDHDMLMEKYALAEMHQLGLVDLK
jgi:hypothetical protein